MKYRIAIWASAGFFVAGGWAVYALASTPPALVFGDPLMTFVQLTCPIAVLGRSYAISLYWVLVVNAASYAVAGLIVENLRPRRHHASKQKRPRILGNSSVTI
jgi:hypothetical protein